MEPKKIAQLKRKIIFQTSILGFHVDFPGCTTPDFIQFVVEPTKLEYQLDVNPAGFFVNQTAGICEGKTSMVGNKWDIHIFLAVDLHGNSIINPMVEKWTEQL